MPKFKDLTGMTFGNWLVLEHRGFSKQGASLWLAECQCYKHTRRIKGIQALKKNNNCGCRNLPDLTGEEFGKWTVLEWAEKDKWKCECSCDKKTIRLVDGRRLRSGLSESCGCAIIDTCKKYNAYNLDNEYGIGYTTNKNSKYYFDLEDYDKIKNTTWIKSSDNYIVGSSGEYKEKRMHRILYDGIQEEDIIDHKNRKRYDNRKENLRISTNQKNSFNSSRRINNKSGIIGVCWWTRDSNWLAQIKYNYKRIFIGYYNDFDEAVKARLRAELKYFGNEYAPQRHLFKQYGIEEDLE